MELGIVELTLLGNLAAIIGGFLKMNSRLAHIEAKLEAVNEWKQTHEARHIASDKRTAC